MLSQTSKHSRALADVRLHLKSGKTRGSKPRALEEGELEALWACEQDLKKQMHEAAKERAVARINAHTRAEQLSQLSRLNDAITIP